MQSLALGLLDTFVDFWLLYWFSLTSSSSWKWIQIFESTNWYKVEICIKEFNAIFESMIFFTIIWFQMNWLESGQRILQDKDEKNYDLMDFRCPWFVNQNVIVVEMEAWPNHSVTFLNQDIISDNYLPGIQGVGSMKICDD